jgi:hypothetical protein
MDNSVYTDELASSELLPPSEEGFCTTSPTQLELVPLSILKPAEVIHEQLL